MPKSRHDQSSHTETTLWFCMAVLLVAVLGGGGQGDLGDTSAQLLGVLLLGHLGWLAVHRRLTWRSAGWVRYLPVLALALPVLQLVPIPSEWWAAAPARAELGEQLALAGVSPNHVISLNPGATERTLWWLLPPVALFLATLGLSRAGQRQLLIMVLALALVSVVMGMAQLSDGPNSALRFYNNTNRRDAVGFFANRNHLATLLAMALPIALAGTALALDQRTEGRGVPRAWFACAIAVVILLILGIAITHSRAGLLLGMLAVLGCLPITISLRQRRGANRILALAVGFAVMLSVQFAFVGILQKLERDPLEDSRWAISQVTREAATAYAPLGSGLGTFRQAYQPFEARHQPDHVIINHAHNDYLELWLEGGVPALALMAIGLTAWLWRGLQLCRRAGESGTTEANVRFWARVAWLSASLALLHSALDYPLRTTADLAVFAVLAGVAFSGPSRRRTAPGEPQRGFAPVASAMTNVIPSRL